MAFTERCTRHVNETREVEEVTAESLLGWVGFAAGVCGFTP